MAWYQVSGSVHAPGQISNGETIWRVSDENVANPSFYYELKAYKIPSVTKPVLGVSDSRNANGFQIKSAEYWNNIKPDNQLDGLGLFANEAEIAGKSLGGATSGVLDLYMDANGKLVATAVSTGTTTINIPSGGSLVITAQPQYGTIVVSNGALVYTPSNGYTGTDAFTYNIVGQSGDVISTGTCSFSTSAAGTTAIPSAPKSVIDVTGDMRFNCVSGAAVTLYKNGDTNIVGTVTDSSGVGYVIFQNIARVQGDTFKAKAQKSGLTLSGFSITVTTKRKPAPIANVTKQVANGGTVTIAIADLVTDSENATFF